MEYVNRNTGTLNTRMKSSAIRQHVGAFLVDEFNVSVPESVWGGLITLVHELRHHLSMDKRVVTEHMD